jgi:3-dehydroquinate dehydratase-2
MKISIINGTNLGHLGQREPEIYGSQTLDDIRQSLESAFPDTEFAMFQSDIEGEIVQNIWDAADQCDAIVLNPGAFTHTSVALRDAVAGVTVPVVEIHLTNRAAREPFRWESLITAVSVGQIQGFGAQGYHLAVKALIDHLQGREQS